MKKTTTRAVSYFLLPLFVLVMAGAFFFPSVFGATNQANGVVTVTADVSTTCTISNAIVQFGNYAAATGATANANIPMTCTQGVVATVGLDGGTNTNNTSKVTGVTVTRVMNAAALNSWIGYDLFYDAADATANTNPWNMTTDVANVYFGSMTGNTPGNALGTFSVKNGAITANPGGAVAATGTPGITFAAGATGTTSTGATPVVTATGASGGNQSLTIEVFGNAPKSQTQIIPTGAYVDFVGVVATF